ncbi:hypothetical protein [Streptomyces rochei]|uniref:hypothetical protein n=1 Tax=Streptomyces rochei TaxID=1928 RepID=UPI0036FCF6FF
MSVCVNDRDGDGNCPACARNPEAACRMPARQAVHHLFENGLTSYRLDRFLDAYAHELAEKQRALPARCGHCADAAAGEAADLIDPEVSSDG